MSMLDVDFLRDLRRKTTTDGCSPPLSTRRTTIDGQRLLPFFGRATAGVDLGTAAVHRSSAGLDFA
jgi:hypothetical protein